MWVSGGWIRHSRASWNLDDSMLGNYRGQTETQKTWFPLSWMTGLSFKFILNSWSSTRWIPACANDRYSFWFSVLWEWWNFWVFRIYRKKQKPLCRHSRASEGLNYKFNNNIQRLSESRDPGFHFRGNDGM